jgi:outer membrane lipoprotein-sorting protein
MSYLKLSRIKSLSLIALLLIVAIAPAIAQPAGFTTAKNVAALKDALARSNSEIQTVSSDFTQVKNMALLKEKIKSKGKFYFKKEDKVRIEYIQPYTYLMVMNGSQMLIKDEQKTSKINTGNSKMMQSVNRIMIDCMRGTMFQNSDFKTSAFESTSEYLLQLMPVNAAMKKMFSGIEVYLDKKTLDVTQLVMTEQGGDHTNMAFINTRRNLPLNETLFKTK